MTRKQRRREKARRYERRHLKPVPCDFCDALSVTMFSGLSSYPRFVCADHRNYSVLLTPAELARRPEPWMTWRNAMIDLPNGLLAEHAPAVQEWRRRNIRIGHHRLTIDVTALRDPRTREDPQRHTVNPTPEFSKALIDVIERAKELPIRVIKS